MRKLSLSELKASAFVGEPVLKTVSFTAEDGEEVEFDVWIRKMSYKAAVDQSNLTAEERQHYIANNVSKYIVNEDGSPFFESIDRVLGVGDYAQEGGLTANMAITLHKAIDEVNSGGKSKSATKMSSGANSSSMALVEEPSTSPKVD